MNDDVTVVITCFNYGAYLPDAIASALDQEGGPPRVVVVDDGSTDPQTEAALVKLPAAVKLIRQPNRGRSAARNRGMRAAETNYLLSLDADDKLAPGALRCLRAPLDRNPSLGFSYGAAEFFGNWQGTLRFPPFDPYKQLYRSTIIATALMRRELFDDVGGFDPAFTVYEDWEFWLHAIARGWRGRSIDEVTLLYRRHGNTVYAGPRGDYHKWNRRIRRKHADLYTLRGRDRLAAESDLGLVGRAFYRWWWGARPLPARVETVLYALLWRVRSKPAT